MSCYTGETRRPGLSAERTDLAWSRSGLSLLACGAVVLRGLSRTTVPHGNVLVGMCILSLGAFAYALGAWHAYRVRRFPHRRATATDLLPLALGVAFVGISAFVVGARFPT